jgi:hypothetical protein
VSTRSRSRPGGAKTYTARLQQRTAAPKPIRRWPAWLTARQLPAVLSLAGEAGHLAAAVSEWPAATPRGVFHIAAAAGLGLVAVGVYFGPTRLQLTLGIAISLILPGAWLAGAVAGLSPYQHYPQLAAAALTALEIALAALLIAHRHHGWPSST